MGWLHRTKRWQIRSRGKSYFPFFSSLEFSAHKSACSLSKRPGRYPGQGSSIYEAKYYLSLCSRQTGFVWPCRVGNLDSSIRRIVVFAKHGFLCGHADFQARFHHAAPQSTRVNVDAGVFR